ncbi:MAG: rhamnogalacturonan acetylesterase, partial [Lachnospiraceae bacterium]|nr:rhamnogalacturonan acetylesterase [Lachnospiraceae bacterium]
VFGLYCKRDVTVLDYGKNGASSKSFYDKGLFDPVMEQLEKGDYLFIQFGHNDEKPKADRHTEPDTTYKEYLMKYVNTAREKGAIPVLITPLSRRLFNQDGTIKNSHTNYPNAMMALAEDEEIACIDLCSRSKELYERTGEINSRRWFMYFREGRYSNYPEGKADNTHLSYEGAVAMDELVAKELRMIKAIGDELLLPKKEKQETEEARITLGGYQNAI